MNRVKCTLAPSDKEPKRAETLPPYRQRAPSWFDASSITYTTGHLYSVTPVTVLAAARPVKMSYPPTVERTSHCKARSTERTYSCALAVGKLCCACPFG